MQVLVNCARLKDVSKVARLKFGWIELSSRFFHIKGKP